MSPTGSSELEEALRQPGCPICALALRAVGRYIQTLSYEQVNDVAVRDELRSAGGFCQPHAYRWLREAHNVLGTALIYRDLVASLLGQLSVDEAGGLAGLLRPRGRRPARRLCPACRAQREAEARYLDTLLESLTEPRLAGEFGLSSGLCYVHTRAAAGRGGPAAAVVVERSRLAANALLADLGEVIRKEDYRFRHEARTQAETTAAVRAVAWAVAAEGLTPGS